MHIVTSKAVTFSVWNVVVNQSGEVLVARRSPKSNNPKLWNFPGGGVEVGEDPFAAAKRELWEEVGIKADSVKLNHVENLNTRDRRMTVYIYTTVNADVKVKLNKKECDKYEWLSVKKLQAKSKKPTEWHFPTFMALHSPIVFDLIKGVSNRAVDLSGKEKVLDKAEKKQKKQKN